VAIFIDTWGWLTLRDRREARHAEVDRFYRDVRRRRDAVYTSDITCNRSIPSARMFDLWREGFMAYNQGVA
jgi:hypothetical protein